MKELNKIPSKHLIVQHNDLIASKYDLNLSEMRLILEAVHNVEKDDIDFKEYEIDVEAFLQLVDSKNVSEYSRVKEFCKTILSKPLEIPRGEGKYMWCNWFSNIEYDEKKRKINYSFDPKLKPYLIELKEKFTRFDIRILLKFKSFYALRIYMLLKTEIWKGNEVEYIVKVDEFRQMLKLEDKYTLYGHFKSRVLDIAKKYINEVSDIEMDFEDIKVGRKVEAIRFTVKRNPLKIENKVVNELDMDFKTFKEYVIKNYTNESICNSVPGFKKDVEIMINAAGYLRNKKYGEDLTPDAAKTFWQWLYSNKNRVGDLIEISHIEKRIDTIIGKQIKTAQKDIFGNIVEIFLTIENLKSDVDNKYIIHSKDEHGSAIKTPKSFTLEEIEKIIF
jgi:plasmid replication initiation protein